MTKSVTLQQILGKSDKEYAQDYLDKYVKWCEAHADKDMIYLQKLLANASISVYFMQRFEDIEHQAFEILKPQYNKITVASAQGIYNTMMVDLFSYFPKPLLEAANKLNIIGKHSNNDPSAN